MTELFTACRNYVNRIVLDVQSDQQQSIIRHRKIILFHSHYVFFLIELTAKNHIVDRGCYNTYLKLVK